MKRNNQRGITLISLVITIIILIILAGVTISLIIGENGIISKASEAKEKHIKAALKEEIEIGIANIVIELKKEDSQKNLSKEEIIKRLPNEINNIIVNEDMTGEYKGYYYNINENYNVTIEQKINQPIMATINITDIGTTGFTIEVQADSKEGQIIGYRYKIEDKDTGIISNNIYRVEDVNYNFEHTIIIQIIDENGNEKNVSQKVTTKDREYFMENGIQKTEGKLANATLMQKDEYTNVTMNLTNYRAAYYTEYDLTKYKKIKMDIEIVNKGTASNGCAVLIGIMRGNVLIDSPFIGNHIIEYNETTKPRQIYSIDIDNIEGNYYIFCMKNSTTTATSANIKIYNIWLEE